MAEKNGLLQDRVAVVTGSTSGIGACTVKLFAKEGAKVVVVGRNDERDIENGRQVVKEITEDGGQAILAVAEATEEDQIKGLIEKTIEAYGKLDILYNNAGIALSVPFEETTTDMLDTVFSVNLRSYFLTCRYAIPHLLKSGNGVIINTSSGTGLRPVKNQSVYGTTKGGVINLTYSLALEYADRGIRANAICPGVVRTPLLDTVPKDVIDSLIENIPQKRLAEPMDIAELALFLASDKSGHITGQAIAINGGAYMH